MRAFAAATSFPRPCILTMFPATGELRLRAAHEFTEIRRLFIEKPREFIEIYRNSPAPAPRLRRLFLLHPNRRFRMAFSRAVK